MDPLSLKPPYPSLRLPAEWEPQAAVWFTWPQNADTWTPVWDGARQAYRDFIDAALKYQDVCLLVNDEETRTTLHGEFAKRLGDDCMLSAPGNRGVTPDPRAAAPGSAGQTDRSSDALDRAVADALGASAVGNYAAAGASTGGLSGSAGSDASGRKPGSSSGPAAQAPARHTLRILVCPTNDSWIRDYGALTVEAVGAPNGPGGNRLVTLDFTFNSWGGKYPPWDKDDAVPVFMAAHRGRECVAVPFVLEGGSLDANGRGKLLTTSQCLLNPNRNPDLKQGAIEQVLHDFLGIEDTLWLSSGINGDDTDGHVDDLARFADARTVLCAVETDARDENYAPLRENIAALNRYGKTMDLEVIEIPMPDRLVRAGLRTPATYLNFLILNGAVLVPVFQDKRDDRALQTFEKHFPDRRIEPIDCRSLVFGQGAVHCSSMQEPA